MNRKTLIAVAVALLSIGAIQISGAQAAGTAAATLAGANATPGATENIIKVGHRSGRRFRRFRRFNRWHRRHHWRHFGHRKNCGFFWRKWKYSGRFFWKKRYFNCKYRGF